MTLSVGQVEDLLVADLLPLKASLGVKTVQVYYDKITEEAIVQMAPLLPAILITHAGTEYAGGDLRQQETMSFGLLICDRSIDTNTEARRGSTNNPGTHAMLQAVRQTLLNQTIPAGGFPCRLVEETNVSDSNRISIYRAYYQIRQTALYPQRDINL